MRGIGNDIIDLSSVDTSRANNPRFYSKILSDTEQQLYHKQFAALPFHQYLWLLWSVKEAAYKCLQRHTPHLVFTPVKVGVTLLVSPAQPTPPFKNEIIDTGFNADAVFKSTIKVNNQTLYGCSVIYADEVIHTVVSFNHNFNHVQWGIKQITQTSPEHQSAAVRAFLLDRLKSAHPTRELSIGKHAAGYPIIIGDESLPVSLSHHGSFIAYAL